MVEIHRRPPGPRTPALYQTFQFVSRPQAYAHMLRAKYGDFVSFHSAIGRGIAVFDPGAAREVFASSGESFTVPAQIGGIFGRRAVIATSGELHKRQRKLLNPHFNGAKIREMYATMSRVVDRHLEASFAKSLATRAPLVMTDVTQALTLDVILETVFGGGPSTAAELDEGRELLHDIVRGFSPFIITTTRLHSRLFPPWRRYEAARGRFNTWIDRLTSKRRATGDLGADLLGVLLSTKYDDGASMTDEEIRHQLITLLLAGHETSAIAMAWATYFLLRSPKVLTKLREELSDAATPEAIVKQPYVNAVVSESLRLEPIVTDVMRLCSEPFKLREWTVPAGENIAVMVGAILHDPRVFPDPHVFRPERFLERRYHAGEFLPFGGGMRRCLGAAFAEAELAIAVAAIASRYELELADTQPERAVRRHITMGPARGVRLRVRRRISDSPSGRESIKESLLV